MGLDVTNRSKIQIYQTQDFVFKSESSPILLNDRQCFERVTVFSLSTLYEHKSIKYRPWKLHEC